jgi:hypothetical protein
MAKPFAPSAADPVPPPAVVFEPNREAIARAAELVAEAESIDVSPPEVERPALVTEDAGAIRKAIDLEAAAKAIEALAVEPVGVYEIAMVRIVLSLDGANQINRRDRRACRVDILPAMARDHRVEPRGRGVVAETVGRDIDDSDFPELTASLVKNAGSESVYEPDVLLCDALLSLTQNLEVIAVLQDWED